MTRTQKREITTQLGFALETIEEGATASATKVERVPSKSELTPKNSTDFSQSILDEMETMFRNLDTRRREDSNASGKQTEASKGNEKVFRPGVDDLKKYRTPEYGVFGPDSRISTNPFRQPREEPMAAPFKIRSKRRCSSLERPEEMSTFVPPSHTLSKAERKKAFATGTMKPMSAHDEKTLNTAVALANELTSKSMNDLEGEKKPPQSPNDRSKFHFRFPMGSHHSSHAHEPEKEKETAGFRERRNFSEEAKSVPDLQATITAESKLAYTSLIEEPTPSTSLMTQLVKETSQIGKATALSKESTGILKPATIPKSSRPSHVQFNHPDNLMTYSPKAQQPEAHADDFREYAENILPLPPRTTKPKLIDKPRHIRKYPLKLPGVLKTTTEPAQPQAIIYQNTKSPLQKQAPQEDKGVDVFDGVTSVVKVEINTNPFTTPAGPSTANPFCCFFDEEDELLDVMLNSESESESESTEGATALVKDCKDHVSVEDLLEFADQKPCGRQRGLESDEVRIMCKVLKAQACPEQCLEALELCNWDVHFAIKIVRVKVSVGTDVSLQRCREHLEKTNRDVVKAAARIVSCHGNKN